MRYITKMALAAALTAASFTPALARIPFGAGPIVSPSDYPGAPRQLYDDDTIKTPYPMNYADEAVQTLGFRNGQMDVFSAKVGENDSPFVPTFSGGVGGEGAMLKLQWHPGE